MTLRLWKCDDGTYDICDEEGVVATNVPEKVLLSAKEAAELLKTARSLIAEAMDTHIYNEADGDAPDVDCPYAKFLVDADAVLKEVK